MDIKKKIEQPVEEQLEFVVMPEVDTDKHGLEEHGQTRTEPIKPPPKEPPKAPVVNQPTGGHRWSWLKILAGVLGVIILAVAGYFLYALYFKGDEAAKPLPDIYVDKQDDAGKDTDKDGVTDAREKVLRTSVSGPDSDGDGLADGDEVNIYQSDPLLSDTDGDKFDDGTEAAREFSPTSSSSDKATAAELREWQLRIEQYGLHEPTKTALKLKAAAAAAAKTNGYVNATFGYSIQIPEVLAYRESADRTQVGLYVAGSPPDDPNFNTDAIFINTAVLAGGESLKDWASENYDKYSQTGIIIGSVQALKLEGKSDDCDSTITAIANKTSVVLLNFTCRELTAFSPYYDSIVQSFKWQ